MKTWHRHLVLRERARMEGRLGKAKLVECTHQWSSFDQDTDMYRCRCGATLSYEGHGVSSRQEPKALGLRLRRIATPFTCFCPHSW